MTNLEIINHAIANRYVITFLYKGVTRTVEPYVTGIHRNTDNKILRAWILSGTTTPTADSGWRLFRLDWLSNLNVTNRQFDPIRPGYDRNDDHMSMTYARI